MKKTITHFIFSLVVVGCLVHLTFAESLVTTTSADASTTVFLTKIESLLRQYEDLVKLKSKLENMLGQLTKSRYCDKQNVSYNQSECNQYLSSNSNRTGNPDNLDVGSAAVLNEGLNSLLGQLLSLNSGSGKQNSCSGGTSGTCSTSIPAGLTGEVGASPVTTETPAVAKESVTGDSTAVEKKPSSLSALGLFILKTKIACEKIEGGNQVGSDTGQQPAGYAFKIENKSLVNSSKAKVSYRWVIYKREKEDKALLDKIDPKEKVLIEKTIKDVDGLQEDDNQRLTVTSGKEAVDLTCVPVASDKNKAEEEAKNTKNNIAGECKKSGQTIKCSGKQIKVIAKVAAKTATPVVSPLPAAAPSPEIKTAPVVVPKAPEPAPTSIIGQSCQPLGATKNVAGVEYMCMCMNQSACQMGGVGEWQKI